MSEKEADYRDWMNKGYSAAWDGDWESAANCYRQALVVMPDQPLALTNLGLALFELHHYDEALKVYLHAAKISPQDPLPLEKAAEIYERLGTLDKAVNFSLQAAELYAQSRDLKKAVDCWWRAIRLDPESILAHSRLAIVYERMGDKESAVSEYLALAALLQHAGKVEKALQTVQHAQGILPDKAEVAQALDYLSSGRLLPKPQRKRGATGPLLMSQVQTLEGPAGTELDPIAEARQSALRTLADMLFELSDLEGARGPDKVGRTGVSGVFAHVAKGVERSQVVIDLGRAIDLQTRGLEKEAAEILEKVAESGLDHPSLLFDLGLLKAGGERMQSAVRHLKHAATDNEYAIAANLLLGRIHYKMKRLKESSHYYLEALRSADAAVVPPEAADELRQLYEPLIDSQSRQRDEKSHQSLCQSIEELLVRPGWRAHLVQTRQQLLAPKADGVTTPIAELLMAADSGRLVNTIAHIRQLALQGHLRSAMEEAYWAIQESPAYLPLHSYMAELLIQQGEMEKAITKLTVVAEAYKVRGEKQRAIAMYRQIIELSPMDIAARELLLEELIDGKNYAVAAQEMAALAGVYYALADLEKARQTYAEALRLANQGNVDALQKAALLHRMADIDIQSLDWRQALLIYRQIRSLLPTDEKANEKLVDLNLRLGQQAQAVVELDQYVSLLMEQKKVEQALDCLQRLITDYPQQDLLLNRYVGLCQQQGRLVQAVGFLDQLAHSLADSGERDSVGGLIKQLCQIDPENAVRYKKLLPK